MYNVHVVPGPGEVSKFLKSGGVASTWWNPPKPHHT